MSNTLFINGIQYQCFSLQHHSPSDSDNLMTFGSSLDIERFVDSALEQGSDAKNMLAELCRTPLSDPTPLKNVVMDAISQGTVTLYRVDTKNTGGSGKSRGSSISRGGGSSATSTLSAQPQEQANVSAPLLDDEEVNNIYTGNMRNFLRQQVTPKTARQSPPSITSKTPSSSPTASNTPAPLIRPEDNPVPQFKITVEIAGRTPCRKQSIMLDAISSNTSVYGEQKMRENARPHNHDRHRSLVEFKGLPETPRELTLHIATRGAISDITLPLTENVGKVAPTHKTTTKPLWDNVLIPVSPLGYITDECRRPEADVLRPGWLYVFWNNKLWRELKIEKNLALKDVDVAHYRLNPAAQNQRQAEGHWLTAIWIPLFLNGEKQSGLRMAYFPKPLSWQQIDTFESNPSDLAAVSTLLDDLVAYSSQQSFDGCSQGRLGNISDALLDQDIDEAATGYKVMQPYGKPLRGFRDGGTAVAYLPLTTETLRLRLRYSDGTPCVNKTLQAVINGQTAEQTTDSEGLIEMVVNKDTDLGTLTYWDGDTSSPASQAFEPSINEVDAIEQLSGIQARLNNMGYNAGPVDGLMGNKTRGATTEFQQDYQLSVDGQAGPQTQKMLKQEYGF